MRINWLNKIFSSIFMKLLMILLISGICINLLVGGFFMYIYRGTTKNTPYRKNIVQYVHYLINDLGSPPDVHRAQKISRELSVDISYESPDLSWSTSKTIPPVHQMRLKKFHEDPHVLRGRYRGKYFIIVQQEQGQGQFTFAVARAYRQETGWEIKVVFLIGLLTLVLGGVYLTIRWILRPVKWLNEGVQHVSGGNLDYRLPVKKSDELGKLAEAFNTMTARIREMLHSKEQLLMDVSHELRSPLTRMKVALEFLPETQAKRNLGEDVSEMEKMVSEILETARLQTEHGHLNLQRVNMAELIREMTEIYTNKPPGIEAEDMPENVVLDVDRERIKTVLKNILDNAVKYSDSNSVPVKVSLKQKEAYVIVHITDSGKGIPPEDLPYIFEPFYRVDKSRARHTGGYGLGLSLCKTIMEVHQGKIEVDSSPDNGTIVSLFFPAPQAVSSDEHH